MASSGRGKAGPAPEIYECSPPEWLPQISSNSDLGYINFFPPRPGQESDVLTENVLKQGLALKPIVSAETFTSKSKQIESLKDELTMHELEDFMDQIFRRRTTEASKIQASTFRTPARTAFNDTKRKAWFDDLANPDVPLAKLGKSIPHSARNHELLDLLYENNVAIPRAVWFIRAFGSNETAGLRNKPNYNPMQYSVDWAIVVTTYLKKQLVEIMLPSAPRLGLSIRQTFRGILGDPETRERWVSKFSYSIDLLRVFYLEFMVDHTTFLVWLVQTIGSSNLAQAAFVARLAEDYLDEMYSCRALLRPFIDACLTKLQEISSSSSKDTLEQLQTRLVRLLQRTFLTSPSAFVSPRSWKCHADTLKSIIGGNEVFISSSSENIAASVLDIQLYMLDTLQDIEMRNEALLFRNSTQPAKGLLRSMVSDVLLLNQITTTTDLRSVSFLDDRKGSENETFSQKLHLLFSWSVCHIQYGDHRPHAAVTLLSQWRERAEERASRRDFAFPDEEIQDELFLWLDTNEEASDERNARMVSLLFGELIQKGLFSYDKYIQRLIARGEIGLSLNEEHGSRHRTYLRTFPLYSNDPALINQRRFALHGVRARTIPEDQIEAQIKAELQALLPEIFGGGPSVSMPRSSVAEDSVLRTAARYEQIRIVRLWFMPDVRKFFAKAFAIQPEDSITVLRLYCTVIECLDVMKCYRRGLELSLDVIRTTATTDLLMTIVDNLRRSLDMWVCMDAVGNIVQTLFITHQAWKSKGVHIRCLTNLLLEVDEGRYLGGEDRQIAIEDAVHFAQALAPVGDAADQMPPVLSDVLLLVQNYDPDAPSSLASALWFKYRNTTDWDYVVWDNVMTSLREAPLIIVNDEDQRACAVRYAKFLLHIDLHSTNGINENALRWFIKTGFESSRYLPAASWNITSHVFLYLTVHGSLAITTLLQGLIYPSWELAALVADTSQAEDLFALLEAANKLCRLILVERLSASEDGLPPTDLLELQKLKTRRREVYRDGNFIALIQSIPVLVFVEQNEHFSEDLRRGVTELRRSITCKTDFRLGSARHVSTVVDSFSIALNSKAMQEKMHEHLISALRLIFNDDSCQLRETGFLSPWKLSSSAAVTSFVLQQIGQRLSQDSTREQAEAELRELAGKVMQSADTAEQADFVSEMVKGATVNVVGEFVNRGLHRVADVLGEVIDASTESLTDLPSKAGHFLKLLSAIMQPFRQIPEPIPIIEEDVRDALSAGLAKVLSMLMDAFDYQAEKKYGAGSTRAKLTECTLFLARLLHFFLGFPDIWKGKMLDLGGKLLNSVLELTLVHGQGIMTSPIAFTLLLDTVFYVFDEFPPDIRHPPDPFLHCPSIDSSRLGVNMLNSYRNLVITLLKHTPRNALTDDLIYIGRDTNGEIQYGPPVQMRPWEWMEFLGEVCPPDCKDVVAGAEGKTHFGIKREMRNNTSIPLEMLGARMTGESVRQLSTASDGQPLDLCESLRSVFEDDLASESIYERHWREGRIGQVEPIEVAASDISGASGDVGDQLSRHQTPGSFRASPALSVHTNIGSRSSAGPPLSAASSRRTQSPVFSNRGESMDVDPPPSATSMKSKRKASTAGLPIDKPTDRSTATDDSTVKGKHRSVAGKGTSSKGSAKTSRKKK